MNSFKILIVMALTATGALAAKPVDLNRAADQARQDVVLTERAQAHDAALKAAGKTFQFVDANAAFGVLDTQSCINQCVATCTSGAGTGEAACWSQCKAEGWSFGYCKSQCGTTSDQGATACWNACKSDGWSFSYCKGQCGATGSGGEAGCWKACGADGWSFSYCATNCGKSTSDGIQACAARCQADGWSFSYCKSQCGF